MQVVYISGEQLIVVSSAKDYSFKLVELLMSLTNIKNNRGPNIDPNMIPIWPLDIILVT